jgi:small-conductance mechanosensitive channel
MEGVKLILTLLQGTNPFDEFKGLLGSFDLWGWKIPIMGLIILAGIIAVIFIIYKVLFRIFNRRIILQGSSPDVYNGLKFLIRLIIGIIIIILIMNFLNIQSSYLIIITGIVISAISFASMNAITNFIAGIWILVVRPFTIGDYITIDGTDGIVIEISLNYTRLKCIDETIFLIPNINCINTNITNHTVSKIWLDNYITRLEQTRKSLAIFLSKENEDLSVAAAIREELSIVSETLRTMEDTERSFFTIQEENQLDKSSRSQYVHDNKIVRYVLELNLNKRVNHNEKLFEEVCQKWAKKFLIKPYWQLYGADYCVYYRFILLTPDPELIIKYQSEFVEDIYKAVFTDTN